MTDRPSSSSRSPVELLPEGTGSLARGIPVTPAGTLFVLGDAGGIRVAPTQRFTVVFGRNRPDVHVCVGEDDPRVSRQHGLLRCDGQRWTVRNTGGIPIRMPGSQLLLTGQEDPVGATYTPMFIRTEQGREHLLEVRVSGREEQQRPRAGHSDDTARGSLWTVTDEERLVLSVLGQRYLRHEGHPQPLSWTNTADELAQLQPTRGWTPKRAEWVVTGVRKRLSGAGVRGLTRDEVGEPVGNALNHNLIIELLVSTTLVPPDLRLLHG